MSEMVEKRARAEAKGAERYLYVRPRRDEIVEFFDLSTDMGWVGKSDDIHPAFNVVNLYWRKLPATGAALKE